MTDRDRNWKWNWWYIIPRVPLLVPRILLFCLVTPMSKFVEFAENHEPYGLDLERAKKYDRP